MEPKPLRIPTDDGPTSLLFTQCGHGVLNMELLVIFVVVSMTECMQRLFIKFHPGMGIFFLAIESKQ